MNLLSEGSGGSQFKSIGRIDKGFHSADLAISVGPVLASILLLLLSHGRLTPSGEHSLGVPNTVLLDAAAAPR